MYLAVEMKKELINMLHLAECGDAVKLPVEQNTVPPIRWSKYNFPNLSKTHRCEMCTIHSNCQTEHLLCHAVLAAPATPFLPIEFDHGSPENVQKPEIIAMRNHKNVFRFNVETEMDKLFKSADYYFEIT